jgi:hypothetical protein
MAVRTTLFGWSKTICDITIRVLNPNRMITIHITEDTENPERVGKTTEIKNYE